MRTLLPEATAGCATSGYVSRTPLHSNDGPATSIILIFKFMHDLRYRINWQWK